MRTLLTGSTSAIGSYVYDLLEKDDSVEELVTTSRRGEHYYGWFPSNGRIKHIECHLNCQSWVQRLFSEFKPHVVVNLCGLGRQNSSLEELYLGNFSTTMNLLEYAPKGCKFIHLSTVLTHNSFPANGYILSKRHAEDLVRYYHAEGRVNATIVQPCAIVGRGSTHGILPDVIRKVQQDEVVKLIGAAPGTIKPYCYAGELAELIHSLAIDVVTCDEIMFGSYHSISSLEVAKTVMTTLQVDKPIEFDNVVWPGDQLRVFMPELSVFSYLDCHEAIVKAVEDINESTT